MSAATITPNATRELARRVSNGIEVTLLWHGGDHVTVLVYDARAEDGFEIPVDPARALDAFHHPFSYAALRRSEYSLVG